MGARDIGQPAAVGRERIGKRGHQQKRYQRPQGPGIARRQRGARAHRIDPAEPLGDIVLMRLPERACERIVIARQTVVLGRDRPMQQAVLALETVIDIALDWQGQAAQRPERRDRGNGEDRAGADPHRVGHRPEKAEP